VPVGLPGEPKEDEGKNKEVAFPGFPALKHQQQQQQQQQTVSEDDSANTGDLNTNQQLKLAQTQASQLQSKKRNALPEEAVAWGSSDLDSCCEDSSKSGATAKRAKREGGTDSDTNTNACQSKKKEEDSVDRKEKNRRSAALSRERKKAAMDSMLLRCKALESTNATLNYLLSMANVEIQALRRELASSNTSARSVGNNNKGFTKKSTETEQTGPTYLPEVGVTPFSVPPTHENANGQDPNQLTGLLTCLPKESNGKIAIPSLHARRRNAQHSRAPPGQGPRSKPRPRNK
jgi:hypothetical protein